LDGTIFDIKKYSIHDGPGIRTTVFLKGCPLKCWWCQNPESQNPEPDLILEKSIKREFYSEPEPGKLYIGKKVTSDFVMQEIEKDLIFYDESGGGVTFCGGEPLMQPEFLFELLSRCRDMEIHTAVDTTGYADRNILAKISGVTSLFLYDIKLINSSEHKKYTGVEVELVLNNLTFLAETGAHVIVRIPVIPGITDTETNISQIIDFLGTLGLKRVDLLPFNQFGFSKYKRIGLENKMKDSPAIEPEVTDLLKKRFEAEGFNVKIGG